MSNLSNAIELATRVFEGHTDKGGTPYIEHCLHVMKTIRSNEEHVMIAAVLHDVVEDFSVTGITMDDLQEMGFNSKVMKLMMLVTHDKENTSYDDYIKAIALDKDAIDIKMADLRHNSDIDRLKGVRKKDLDRMEKYQRHYMYLKDVYNSFPKK